MWIFVAEYGMMCAKGGVKRPRKNSALGGCYEYKGYCDSMFLLGCLYAEGNGVKANMRLVKMWWKKAAKAGNASGQYNMGIMYLAGDGVKKNYEKVVEWYRKAAEQGNAGAQRMMGYMYTHGKGVEKDYDGAMKQHRTI